MNYTTLAIVLIIIGLGLMVWAYVDARRRRRQRSLVGVSLVVPAVMAVGGLLTVGGGAVVSNLSTIGFTITCAEGVKPIELGFHTVLLDDSKLRKGRTPEDPNVYKGEFTVLLFDDTAVVWVRARGLSNNMNTCNFKCDDEALFKKDQEFNEVSPGTYLFESKAIIP